MSNTGRDNKILFWASFLTLIAAGMGFSIRGAILGDWARQFGFTKTELGDITGGGLAGFCFGIFFFSFLTDKFGYGKVMIFAFLFHVLSAVITLCATPVFQSSAGKDGAYWCLFIGSFVFSVANGTCEAVINPLTATLFPNNKTHWLNILHAGWPGGLILGAIVGLIYEHYNVQWEIQIASFLAPTLLYGLLMFRRPFPHSEAKKTGVSIGTMLAQFASPILLFLVLIHAMVGSVELGTDSWITNITGTILENKSDGLKLFLWTSSLMFILRFFAGPIVHQISPLGLLFVSALLGCAGLLLLGKANGALMCIMAATIYGFGKTFFWPTMLGVVSERFPKGGALALGVVGGVGMLSAGLFGGPGIGYGQDYYASQKLQEFPHTYQRYKALDKDGKEHKNSFLMFPAITGLDGAKVGVLIGDQGKDNGDGKTLEADVKAAGDKIGEDKYKSLRELEKWWNGKPKEDAATDKPHVLEATEFGGREALICTAAIPATMAFCYLLLILYFRAIGGYKQVHIDDPHGGMSLPATPE
jgi:MFS family permease